MYAVWETAWDFEFATILPSSEDSNVSFENSKPLSSLIDGKVKQKIWKVDLEGNFHYISWESTVKKEKKKNLHVWLFI